LVNGAAGTIKDIIYPDNCLPDSLPDAIIVHFPHYIGPQFFTDEARKNWIPINAKIQYSKLVNATRKQYPLRLRYAMTTHKTQGETLNLGVIDLGKNERSLGSTFVQLSRFKKITDFLIKPFPFSRLTKISLSTLLMPRMTEELRLNNLNITTQIKYKHLIPK
jgi:hypothetical protein